MLGSTVIFGTVTAEVYACWCILFSLGLIMGVVTSEVLPPQSQSRSVGRKCLVFYSLLCISNDKERWHSHAHCDTRVAINGYLIRIPLFYHLQYSSRIYILQGDTMNSPGIHGSVGRCRCDYPGPWMGIETFECIESSVHHIISSSGDWYRRRRKRKAVLRELMHIFCQ